jgi:hypothetical protein
VLVTRSSERGSAMLVTLILISAVLMGAVAMTSMQVTSNRSTEVTRAKISSLHCAEAGLAMAHAAVARHYSGWNAYLGRDQEPDWLSQLDHDLDDDGIADFSLRLRDNHDEASGDDPAVDNDLAVYLVASCVKYVDARTEVIELVRFSGGGTCYEAQLGGCGGNANAN